MAVQYSCCSTGFFIHIAVVVFLVLFAGLMSGLTLGLMSLSLVDLEVLAKSGTPKDKLHAGTISTCFDFSEINERRNDCALVIFFIVANLMFKSYAIRAVNRILKKFKFCFLQFFLSVKFPFFSFASS